MKKRNLRIASGVLAMALLVSTNVFATTTAEYDAQISEIKEKQAQNEAEAEELNAQLESLRSETADAQAYQETLVAQIENYQESIDLARERIDELNSSISTLEDEIEKADAEYADTFEQLKVRLNALYTSGGELTTLEILLDSTSLYDFSVRSEAIQGVTRHDKQLMEEIKAYMLQTQEQRDELSVQKEELAEQKKDLESKQSELQVLEEENQRLIEELQLQSAEAENLIAENEAESQDYLAQLDSLIAQRSEQAAREEAERQQALENQQNQGGGSSDAAAVLRALNELNGGALDDERLYAAAMEAGSDVPYCLMGGAALAEGRGEKLTALPALPRTHVVICMPHFSCSTPELFGRIDARRSRCHPDTNGIIDAITRGDVRGVAQRMYNVFEDVLDARASRTVNSLKFQLLDSGALGAAMSGSGSAVFGLFPDEASARAAYSEVKANCREVFLAAAE